MSPDHRIGQIDKTMHDPQATETGPSYKNNWKYKTCSDHTYCLDARTTKIVADFLKALSK